MTQHISTGGDGHDNSFAESALVRARPRLKQRRGAATQYMPLFEEAGTTGQLPTVHQVEFARG